MSRPDKNEYAEYYEKYISLVAENNIVAAMQNQLEEFTNLFASIPEAKGAFSYAPNKWTIKELVGHLIDGERIFAYRALRFSRSDKLPIEGFEQDDYVANADFNSIKLADLVEELSLLRRANILFFKNLTTEMQVLKGTASNAEISVRALAFIMVGHIRHHLNILNARYLAQ
jgi:DinB superfamily